MLVFAVVAGYVLSAPTLVVLAHYFVHGVVSPMFIGLSFFCCLNILICVWEVSLGVHITAIKAEAEKLKGLHKEPFQAVKALFLKDITVQEALTLKTWSSIWSTYSLYDPSYANRESFGFFIDVGNGWSSLVPSTLFLVCTINRHICSARTLGIMGVLLFYQMFYGACQNRRWPTSAGTVIYFLSFFFNKRHHGKRWQEVAMFVGVSNGLWFLFPILGMHTCTQMIYTDSFGAFD